MKKKIIKLTIPGDNPFNIKEIINIIDKKAIVKGKPIPKKKTKDKEKILPIHNRVRYCMRGMGSVPEWETIKFAFDVAMIIKFLFDCYNEYRIANGNNSVPLLFERGKQKVKIDLQKPLSTKDFSKIVDLFI